MKKTKIYLDTSVLSHLKQEDVPEKMADTLKLWEDIRACKYDVYMSNTTLMEIQRCKPDKLDLVMRYVEDVNYSVIGYSDEINLVAEQIIDLGILTRKSLDDCIHIASAVVGCCDIIVSWNFKHLVNIKTIKGVRAITNLQGYNNIDIVSPTMLLESEVD